MDYDKLTREEATDILRNHDEATWEDDRLWDEVIEPADVLYYLDAFGDQSLAINCQGLPKDLPDSIYEGINEFDIFNDWTGTVNRFDCPTCYREMFEFEFGHDSVVYDEYGDYHFQPEFLDGHAGYYWNATGDAPMMCQTCSESYQTFGRMDESHGTPLGVRIFYGEDNEYARFRHSNGVVRYDSYMYDHDDGTAEIRNMRSTDGLMVGSKEIVKAFAAGGSERDDLMNHLGFKLIEPQSITVSVSGMKRAWRYAEEILEGWARLDEKKKRDDPTHPDLDFTYIIEDGSNVWVAEENAEELLYHLEDQVLFESNSTEKLREHRNRAE